MAVNDYTIKYDASTALKAAQDVDRYTQAILGLVAAYEAYKKTKVSFASVGSSAAKAAPQVLSLNAALNATAAAGNAARISLGGISAGSLGATRSLGGLNVQARALSTGIAVFHSLNQAMEEARDYAKETAEAVGKLRDNTRELKSMIGQGSTDNSAALGVLKLSSETGADVVKATHFAERFQGAVPRGEDKGNIAPDVKEQLRAESLRTAMRLGVDPGTMGKMAGGMTGYQKVPNLESGMDQVAGALWGMEKGRDSYDQHVKALEKLAPIMVKGKGGGGIRDFAEAGVVLGAVDPIAGSADQAQQMIIQSNRLMSRTTGKQGEWLKSKGVTPDMDWDQKMEKIAPFIKGPGGEQVLEDLGFNKMLGDMGFSQQRQREVTIAIAKELPIIQKRLKEKRSRGFGKEAIAKNADYMKNDPSARTAVAKSKLASAKLMRGLAGEMFSTAQIEAEAALTAEGGIDTSATNASDSLYDWTIGIMSGEKNRQTRINLRAITDLQKGFEAVNVSAKEFHQRYPAIGSGTIEVQQERYAQAYSDLRKQGGAPAGVDKAVVQKLDQLIDINKQQLAQQKNGNVGGGRAGGAPGAVKPARP